jgi:hypothetical protein
MNLQEVKEYSADKEAFKNWLLNKRGEWVKKNVYAETCPLACYFNELHPEYKHEVGSFTVGEIDRTGKPTPEWNYYLPVWARIFVIIFDETKSGIKHIPWPVIATCIPEG